MLTIDTLRQNGTLAGLSDEQFNAIAEMSRNDENTVIGTRIGELHGQYDNDIFGITGIHKNQGEKSYEYAKRVLNEYKSQIASTATTQAQLQNAKNEVEKLKSQLAAGGSDEQLKQQLKDAKSQVSQLQKQLSDKEAEFNTAKAKYDKDIKDIHVDYAFSKAASELKFKEGITQSVQNIMLQAAKAEVFTKGTPDFIDGKLVFRDNSGNVLNNPNNNLNPYTAAELLSQTSLKDIIDTGIKQTGGGTGPVKPTSSATMLDLSGIKTQVEADKAIEAHLLSQGLTRDDVKFGERLTAIRTENKISELPIR